MPKMLSVNEVMERLGVSRTQVYKLLRIDAAFPRPHYLTPRCPRFREDEVAQWLESRRVAA